MTPSPSNDLTHANVCVQIYDPSFYYSSAVAHEKAYNHLKSPQDRLAHLTSLPEVERERPDVAKKIDQAEVDLGKREAQLEATAGRYATSVDPDDVLSRPLACILRYA